MFKLAFIILLISCSRHRSKITEQITSNVCINNKTNKFLLLPATYQAKEIFIGASGDSDFLYFINFFSQELKNDPININLILPSRLSQSAIIFFDNLKNVHKNINLLAVASDNTQWAQDYFEIFHNNNGAPQIVDLPYLKRSSEFTPGELATKLKLPLLKTPNLKSKFNDGNLGGNIEAINDSLVIVGDSMSEALSEWLKSTLAQEILKLKTNWLATGHVDELFAILPTINGSFKLAYSSPQLAIELLKAANSSGEKRLSDFEIVGEEMFNNDKFNFKKCLISFPTYCQELFKANLKYESIIQSNLSLIMKKLNLSKKDLLPLPVLFSPKNKSKDYGQKQDLAETINPNLTNFISLNNKIFMPKQVFAPFESYVEHIFSDLNLKLIWAPARFAQTLSGGLHCSSQVLRTCH